MKKQGPTKIIESLLGCKYSEIFKRLISQKLEKSDAIIFLQGDRLDRAKTVKELYQKGFSKIVFITGNNDFIGRGRKNDENDISLNNLKNYFLEAGVSQESIIIDDKSMNTLDQAKTVIKLAKEKKWKNFIVVTSPYHLLRTFLAFLKQAKARGWKGKMQFQGADLGWSKIPSGRSKIAIEILKIEIDKIKKYKKDIASLREAEIYLRNI